MASESEAMTPIKKRSFYSWDEEEVDTFVEVVRTHGKNYTAIQEVLQHKTRLQIKDFCRTYCKAIRADPSHSDSDLLSILEKPLKT